MIQVRIAKRFRASYESAPFALEVEFEAGPGVTVLFGPSGSGKTLTLDTVAGFAVPDSGRVMLNDRILCDTEARVHIAPRNRRCGYVFQNYALFPHMTLRENLAFAADCLPRLERHRQIKESLERFQLAQLAGRYPSELSGGEQQRGSIARALMAKPEVLLLDEPARGLDQALRHGLHQTLQELRSMGIPILLVTHGAEEMTALADHVLVYRAGRIICSGSPLELLRNPGTESAAQVLGGFCFLDAEVRALDPGRQTSRLRIFDEDFYAAYLAGCFIGDRVRLCVRPEELRLHAAPGQNRLRVQAPTVLDRPDSVYVTFGNGLAVELSRDEWAPLAAGNVFWLEIPSKSFRRIRSEGQPGN